MNGGILGMLAPQSHAASNGGLLGQLQQAWRPVWQDQGIGQGAGASPFTTQQLMGALGHGGSPVYGSYSGLVAQQNAGAGGEGAPAPAPAPAATTDRPTWVAFVQSKLDAYPGAGRGYQVSPGLMKRWQSEYAQQYFPDQTAYGQFLRQSAPFTRRSV